jgi:hypothetical protein
MIQKFREKENERWRNYPTDETKYTGFNCKRPNWRQENAPVLKIFWPGANPTTLIHNATDSRARFENKNIFFHFENALAYYKAGVVAVNS